MNIVRYRKNIIRKNKKLIYPYEKIIKDTDFFTGRTDTTACSINFELGINNIGGITTSYGNPYINFVSILNDSNTFQIQYQTWGRYKITSLSILATPSDSIGGFFTNLTEGAPSFSVCIYPSLINFDFGNIVKNSDNNFVIHGGLNYSQGKRWNFPDNMIIDKNGTGLGVWCNSPEYPNQIGEICFVNNSTTNTTLSGTKICFNVRLTFTIVFGFFAL